MNENDINTMFSHKSDTWTTPQWLFDKLNKIYKFTLDPASSDNNHKCAKFFTEKEDGLKQSWKDEIVFVNPPYSQIKEWVKKAHEERINNKTITVMLIPSRTDTKWFHEIILKNRYSISFIKGRLKFGEQKNSAPFPSMIVYFDNSLRWIYLVYGQ